MKNKLFQIIIGIGLLQTTLFPTQSTSNKLWYDKNQDGIQNEKEMGIPNVTVRLLSQEESPVELSRTISNSNGDYKFDYPLSLKTQYYVKVELLEDEELTLLTQGDNPEKDSDAYPNQSYVKGRTKRVTGQDLLNHSVDIGFKEVNPERYLEQEKGSVTISLNRLKAFPTAQGAGANASGGRGGRILYVTTNEMNEKRGSLAYALNQTGKRTILFAVGGEFKKPSSENYHKLNTGNLTIAGQTANDLGGVYLSSFQSDKTDRTNWTQPYYLKQSNYIIRYITARGGWKNWHYKKVATAMLDLQQSHNLILDHFSGGWGSYCLTYNKARLEKPSTDISPLTTDKIGVGDFTFQHSLCVENIEGHNVSMVTGFSISDGNTDFTYDTWNNKKASWDIHHNAFILNSHRQPSNTAGGKNANFSLISNFTYGWNSRLARHSGNAKLDIINNYFQKAVSNKHPITHDSLFKVGTSKNFDKKHSFIAPLYIRGNQFIKRDGKTPFKIEAKNQLNETVSQYHPKDTEAYHQFKDTHANYLSREIPIKPSSINHVKKRLLKNVGAGVRFDGKGEFMKNNDPVDRQYLSYARKRSENSKGHYTIGDISHFNPNNYEPFPSTSRRRLSLYDSDFDGLPNWWENLYPNLNIKKKENNGVIEDWKIYQLNPDHSIVEENGEKVVLYKVKNLAHYTNLEIYLAYIAGDFHMIAKRCKSKYNNQELATSCSES